MQKRDARVEVNSEVLSSMKVIKLQAWEEPFSKRLNHLRDTELEKLWNYVLANSVSIMLWSATPLCVALATFCAYVLSGHELQVASALTSLALFDILRFPLFMLPQIINRIVDASISLNRISSFLLSKEHTAVGEGSLNSDGEISIKDATFCYESKKYEQNKDITEQEWEIALLQAQLQDAENQIKLMNANQEEGGKNDATDATADGEQHAADTEDAAQPSDNNLLCLKRINLHVGKGQLVAIIGGVGCGKSSLLNAILGEEVRQLQGHTSIKGTVSYFAQSPFIFNDTLRNNILFSLPYDKERYERVLDSCALRHDLKLLSSGDFTEIGEKGITLSGGQKARVALARCLYANSQIVLLDDPLAAVDAHVGNHLFQQCIIEDMVQQGKTVVLVTNALQYLNHPLVNKVIVVRDGRVAEQGTFQDLMKVKNSLLSRFMDVLQETGISPTETEGCGKTGMIDNVLSSGNDDDTETKKTYDDTAAGASATVTTTTEETADKDDSDAQKTEKGILMTNEFQERVVGHVGRDVYLAWGRAAGGVWVPFVILFAYAGVETVTVSTKWWLTYWSQHGTPENQLYYLGIYAIINLLAVFTAFLRLLLIMSCSLRASRRIFERLLKVVLQAPMAFFDTTPIGRIINRFSKDMYTIDEQLVATLRSYLATLANVFSTIIVISGVTPIFTLCLIPILIFYAMQQAYFTMTYRELKRLDSIGRSPIYALLGETLDGVTTIRAFGAQSTLANRLETMLDRQQHAYYLTFAAQCWLAIRLELVGTLIITFACLCSVLEHPFKGGDENFAGLAGLSISFALSVTQSLNWSVRMASDFEANMVAVERVEQYSSIPSEAKRHTDVDKAAGKDWPARGEVQFINAKLRYRQGLPLVLKGLDILIPAASKVGIVGRTGAGKSTLMVALLRIVELDSGKILIDGFDHKNLGLALVRSKIAVIPQDPVLFSGTIRTNLDPFEEYSNERLLDALTRVGLYSKTTTSSSTLSLTSLANAHVQSLTDTVMDGGSNFSVGQRQLLVIARALLCGASVVIMDEATAAVDADTDARIQGVMRTEFKNATTLTVAHRINTIMDSDYILVMDDGRAAEFDSPSNLLDRGGMFKDLVDAAAKEGH